MICTEAEIGDSVRPPCATSCCICYSVLCIFGLFLHRLAGSGQLYRFPSRFQPPGRERRGCTLLLAPPAPDMNPEEAESATDVERQEDSDVTAGLLQTENASHRGSSPGPKPSARNVLLRLYISHTLSTWNSRIFEFGAVLFLARVFQGTLLYVSMYALLRSLAIAVLSSWLGAVVDRSDRLVTLRQSIVWQRVPVALSCACFVVLLRSVGPEYAIVVACLFVVIALLACVEKSAASVNTVAIERDWVWATFTFISCW